MPVTTKVIADDFVANDDPLSTSLIMVKPPAAPAEKLTIAKFMESVMGMNGGRPYMYVFKGIDVKTAAYGYGEVPSGYIFIPETAIVNNVLEVAIGVRGQIAVGFSTDGITLTYEVDDNVGSTADTITTRSLIHSITVDSTGYTHFGYNVNIPTTGTSHIVDLILKGVIYPA